MRLKRLDFGLEKSRIIRYLTENKIFYTGGNK